jgi:hypothetical protein
VRETWPLPDLAQPKNSNVHVIAFPSEAERSRKKVAKNRMKKSLWKKKWKPRRLNRKTMQKQTQPKQAS